MDSSRRDHSQTGNNLPFPTISVDPPDAPAAPLERSTTPSSQQLQTRRSRAESTHSSTLEPTIFEGRPLTPTQTQQRGGSPTPSLTLNTTPTSGRRRATSSIRLRRLPSTSQLNQQYQNRNDGVAATDFSDAARRRSTSEPQRPVLLPPGDNALARQSTYSSQMPGISEEHAAQGARSDSPYLPLPGQADGQTQPEDPAQTPAVPPSRLSRMGLQRLGSSFRPTASRPTSAVVEDPYSEYDSQVVDLLDVVDPEVSTLSTLTNVQNSLFVPDLGRFLNRRPTYNLSPRQWGAEDAEDDRAAAKSLAPSRVSTATVPKPPSAPKPPMSPKTPAGAEADFQAQPSGRPRPLSISSTLSESRYAVLPHGVSLVGWSEEDKALLNDHVRHQLHSKRSAFKRSMRGFGKYISKPLGFFVTLYAVLITLFGLAWVLFLIGWISVAGRQSYLINVIDNVLVALFAVMGDGLAPFRAVDTYHMCFIAHYHYLTWKLRKQNRLPKLENHNDLPTETPTNADSTNPDLENGIHEKQEMSVLTQKQQDRLTYHAQKYSKSHTFYRPHETETHYAFPVKLLITVTVLLDCHSLFQIALGTCTWSINYHVRSQALTTVILCCSISCNIAGGIVIAVGDRRTRKKEIIETHFRQDLTRRAIEKVQKKKREEGDALFETTVVEEPSPKLVADDGHSIVEKEKYRTPPTSPAVTSPRTSTSRLTRVTSPRQSLSGVKPYPGT